MKPTWDTTDVPGIFDVNLELVSATSTSIKFKALSGCGSDPLTYLVGGDIVLRDVAGAVQSPTFIAADANGIYELSGTSFATGFTVDLDGVVVKTEYMYEAESPLTITVTP